MWQCKSANLLAPDRMVRTIRAYHCHFTDATRSAVSGYCAVLDFPSRWCLKCKSTSFLLVLRVLPLHLQPMMAPKGSSGANTGDLHCAISVGENLALIFVRLCLCLFVQILKVNVVFSVQGESWIVYLHSRLGWTGSGNRGTMAGEWHPDAYVCVELVCSGLRT